MIFLIATGFVIFTANGFARCFLHMRQFEEEQTANGGTAPTLMVKMIHGASRSLPTLFTRLVCLGLGFWFNISSANYLRDTYSQSDPSLTIEERITFRKMHDMTHGTWHFMTAVVIMGLGLSLVEGLTGRIEPPRGYMRARQDAAKEYDAPDPRATKAKEKNDVVEAADAALDAAEAALDAVADFGQEYARFFARESKFEMACMLITATLPLVFVLLIVSGVRAVEPAELILQDALLSRFAFFVATLHTLFRNDGPLWPLPSRGLHRRDRTRGSLCGWQWCCSGCHLGSSRYTRWWQSTTSTSRA